MRNVLHPGLIPDKSDMVGSRFWSMIADLSMSGVSEELVDNVVAAYEAAKPAVVGVNLKVVRFVYGLGLPPYITAVVMDLIEDWFRYKQKPNFADGFRRRVPSNWSAIRASVISRDGNECRYCCRICDEIHIDHVIALRLGGSNHEDNLVVSCSGCNRRKGDSLPGVWMP